MTEQAIRIAVAKVDGRYIANINGRWYQYLSEEESLKGENGLMHVTDHQIPDYPNNSDAIRDVIRKQSIYVQCRIGERLMKKHGKHGTRRYLAPASDLCEFLLRELGLWIKIQMGVSLVTRSCREVGQTKNFARPYPTPPPTPINDWSGRGWSLRSWQRGGYTCKKTEIFL